MAEDKYLELYNRHCAIKNEFLEVKNKYNIASSELAETRSQLTNVTDELVHTKATLISFAKELEALREFKRSIEEKECQRQETAVRQWAVSRWWYGSAPPVVPSQGTIDK